MVLHNVPLRASVQSPVQYCPLSSSLSTSPGGAALNNHSVFFFRRTVIVLYVTVSWYFFSPKILSSYFCPLCHEIISKNTMNSPPFDGVIEKLATGWGRKLRLTLLAFFFLRCYVTLLVLLLKHNLLPVSLLVITMLSSSLLIMAFRSSVGFMSFQLVRFDEWSNLLFSRS